MSATRTTSTISATACTRTTCAPASTAAVTAAAVAQSRAAGGALAGGALQERLSRGADEERAAERVQLVQPREQRRAVLGALREADPRIEEHARQSGCRPPPRAANALTELRGHLAHHVVVVRVAVHVAAIARACA